MLQHFVLLTSKGKPCFQNRLHWTWCNALPFKVSNTNYLTKMFYSSKMGSLVQNCLHYTKRQKPSSWRGRWRHQPSDEVERWWTPRKYHLVSHSATASTLITPHQSLRDSFPSKGKPKTADTTPCCSPPRGRLAPHILLCKKLLIIAKKIWILYRQIEKSVV